MQKREKITAPPMERELHTAAGVIAYTLKRKRVRNLNLRVRTDGSVLVSAPARIPLKEIERFISARAGWITNHQQQTLARAEPPPCSISRDACLALFCSVSDNIFPIFSDVLDGQKPILRLREMKTRWGSCKPSARTITLNTRLAEKPTAAVEYVVLHEYVHFLYPNHQTAFHNEMARLMPDYKQRRKLLRE